MTFASHRMWVGPCVLPPPTLPYLVCSSLFYFIVFHLLNCILVWRWWDLPPLLPIPLTQSGFLFLKSYCVCYSLCVCVCLCVCNCVYMLLCVLLCVCVCVSVCVYMLLCVCLCVFVTMCVTVCVIYGPKILPFSASPLCRGKPQPCSLLPVLWLVDCWAYRALQCSTCRWFVAVVCCLCAPATLSSWNKR